MSINRETPKQALITDGMSSANRFLAPTARADDYLIDDDYPIETHL
jgi:hypothetical protein